MKYLFLFLLLVIIYFYYKKRKVQPKRRGEIEELVLDKNCGLYLSKEEALKLNLGHKELYFCSEKCKEEYLKKVKDGVFFV